MQIDIDKLFDEKKQDLTFRSDSLRKAENVLKVQQGSLYYAQDFGIDLAYFLESAIKFQSETLRAYIIERLASNFLPVSDFESEIKDFFLSLDIKISDEGSYNAV